MVQASKWIRVSKSSRCSLCGRGDWCTVSADGRSACCMRVQSDTPMRNGGWLHRIGESDPKLRTWTRRPASAPPAAAPIPWDDLMAGYASKTRAQALQTLAAKLGVSTASLERLDTAYAAPYSAWAFPMRDQDGQCIGIRLRSDDGRKWAVKGSHNGLFIPLGVPCEQADMLMICEGPTTCAALLDLGYDVIGRPSCSGGVEMVLDVLHRDRKHVVIMADEDEAKARPDGTTWYPGKDGAEALAKALHGTARSVRIIYPLDGKDARDWITVHGATRAVVDTVIREACYCRFKGDER